MKPWLLPAASFALAVAVSCSSDDEETKKTQPKNDAGADVIDIDADAGTETGPECTTHAECSVDGDEPARCVEGKCVQIRTPECPCVPNLPDSVWKEDDSILIGAFAALEPGATSCDDGLSANYRLAFEELNADNVGGIPPGRKLALVICDNQANSVLSDAEKKDQVLQATQHLVENLHVPGILAGVQPSHLVDVFGTYANPNGVFLMSPFGANQALTALPDDKKLLWTMLGTPDDLAATYAALITKMELVVPTLLNQPGPLRIIAITGTDDFSSELQPAVEQAVTFNGKSWAENIADGNLFVHIVTDAASAQAAGVAVINEKPHIVISLTDGGAHEVFDLADSGGVRPYYVLSPLDFANSDAFTQSIENTQAFNNLPNLHDQFVYVNPAGTEDLDLESEYQVRLASAFPGAFSNVENAYDAAYYLAYSLVSAGDPPNGLQMGAVGMPSLIAASPEFNVGPDSIVDVFSTLSSPDAKLRLNGLMGPPTFDANGVHVTTGQLECYFKVANDQLLLRTHVGHFDMATQVLRKAKGYASSPLPCLDWLDLPEPP